MTTASEEAVMLGSPTSSTGSPKNRLKFLCSYGGRILPRPSDGNLKYVGGETRVVVVPRNTTFSGLMRKLTMLFESDVVLKYQLFSEDLDSLVSVTCDEDLQNMIDEYDRQQSFLAATTPGGSAARLRAFLFPANPSPLLFESTTPTGDTLEQRYIDAVNGIRTVNVSPSTRYNQHHLHHLNYPHHRAPSSNESSPRSGVMEQSTLAVAAGPSNDSPAIEFTPLQRVYSSPNLLGNNSAAATAVQQRFCGYKGGRLLGPVCRPGPVSSQVGGHQALQRNGGGGSGRFYSPVHKRGGGGHLEESYHHRREGSGGMWEMDWRS
ncbi:uncharacterized protein LOC116257812 [Nymphaea colorata]|nr:uncharacterized protein LOC116257812 [Nymphaea colorata]